MNTTVDEIADGIFRFSTWSPGHHRAHTGQNFLYPMVSQAISPVIPLDSMRWISFGHRLRFLTTPHIPHNWEAGLWFDETTATLLCATCSPVPGRFRNSPNHIV